MDIDIELLQMNIDDASGHEHRIRPIAARAAEILAAHLDERLEKRHLAGRTSRATRVPGVDAGTVKLDLDRMSDERAALSIATAWIEALTAKLEVGT
jgi:hypothetical protein